MKIIHLLPIDGLGGAEQAARSLEPDPSLNIEVTFICGKPLSAKNHIKVINENLSLNSFSFYLEAIKYLVDAKPDILICSLWRSNLIGIVYKLYSKARMRNNFKLITFIHATAFGSLVDKYISKLVMILADEVWCDSKASSDFIVLNNISESKIKILSFFTRINSSNINYQSFSNKKNNFIFWGRLAKVKRIDKSIRFFKQLLEYSPQSNFYIYGPDYGELNSLRKLVDELSLSDKVLFMGPKPPTTYPAAAFSSKFFLQTSDSEGMAISVIEAMQCGLIPIVTPVGEIKNYCIDNQNSIFFNEGTLRKVKILINDDKLCCELSANAYSYWLNKTEYSQDFNRHCFRLMKDIS